ncbi:glycosyltransferase family 2 protein [Limnobaculum parvum]|uniref:Glycosyltransferase family 2 protein n=1 Tax=Limnobaculum parvum TaxID=2172103 RepID=A0A2Y9U136_9GAMM|nr:glycosyltransferase family 2 protein [Limnobaculum parvum]AWH89655.1 glycosyltransferase family 2 protein [Limnobaculum parvum]
MNYNPLVSVLIPAYNVQDYVEEAINSLLDQTYDNIEIIVVDDCSNDNTLSVLREIERQNKHVRVFSKSENSGIVDSLNYGLLYCQGEFIARMDADDIAINNRIELQLKYLLEHSNIDIVGSSTITVDMHGKGKQISNVPIGKDKINRTITLFSPCFHIWLARAEVYRQLEGYRQLAPAEDYDFLLRAVTYGYGIDNIDIPLMKIRCRTGNTADIAGLKQRKAHNYVVRLYDYRKSNNKKSDLFTAKEFKNFIVEGSLEAKLYALSIKFIKKGFMQSNKIKKIGFFFLASIVSKWQFIYAIKRVYFKILLKI